MPTALVLGLLIPSLAIAQTGSSGSETASEFGILAGTPVPYFSSDGAELGTITVNSIMDPYEDYDPYYSPERGYRYGLR